jgi:hypothetical protein
MQAELMPKSVSYFTLRNLISRRVHNGAEIVWICGTNERAKTPK